MEIKDVNGRAKLTPCSARNTASIVQLIGVLRQFFPHQIDWSVTQKDAK